MTQGTLSPRGEFFSLQQFQLLAKCEIKRKRLLSTLSALPYVRTGISKALSPHISFSVASHDREIKLTFHGGTMEDANQIVNQTLACQMKYIALPFTFL